MEDLSDINTPGEAPDLSKVQPIEGTEDPNWWRTREMSEEESVRYSENWMGNSGSGSFKHLIEQGGGFSGRGVSGTKDVDWPRRVIVYVPPLKGYWSAKGKQSMLNVLEGVYRDIKSEIENA